MSYVEMKKEMLLQTGGYENQCVWSHFRKNVGAPHLFQPLHVFEVESDIKKAEIGIYKLKLQDRNVRCHRRMCKKKKKKRLNVMKRHSLEPF